MIRRRLWIPRGGNADAPSPPASPSQMEMAAVLHKNKHASPSQHLRAIGIIIIAAFTFLFYVSQKKMGTTPLAGPPPLLHANPPPAGAKVHQLMEDKDRLEKKVAWMEKEEAARKERGEGSNDAHAADTCRVEKLKFPFRTVMIQQSTHYKMFLYGLGEDIYISDKAYATDGRQVFERHIQIQMDRQLKGRVPQETIIFDIGANIGTHALYLASKGFQVHAFEPSPENFNLLKCSKVANQFDNLVLNNFGLSNEDGDLCLEVEQNNRGHAVLNTDECPESEKVALKTLDGYQAVEGISPYMIKIDVEGHEFLAFKGGEKMLQKDPPKLIFAEIMWVNKTKFVEFFWSYDYTIYLAIGMKKIERGTISQATFDGQADVVMVHS